MINREEFNMELISILQKNCSKRRFVKSLNELMFENHNMNGGETNRLINGDEQILNSSTIEELYWLTQSICIILKEFKLEKYFTQHEINSYSNTRKRNEIKEKYPIEFDNVLQVSNDQWVTVTDVNTLYELYKNQIINYNKNTQRPTIYKEKDGITEYKIFLNRESMNEIAGLMEDKKFIPNAITLNLNLDNPEIDFEYKNGKLIIYSGMPDIVDGYHRYQAMMKNKLSNEDFNYPTVLNITNFDEVKACSFIAQEDKRNKINKSVLRTMDSTNLINILVQRLNEDSRCYLSGQIGRTETHKVNSTWIYEIIDKCYSIKDKTEMIELFKYLKEIFNAVIEDDLMEYDFITLAIIIKISEKYRNENGLGQVEKALKNKKLILSDKYKSCKMTKILISEIENLIKE
jgi:hypothetical protein